MLVGKFIKESGYGTHADPHLKSVTVRLTANASSTSCAVASGSLLLLPVTLVEKNRKILINLSLLYFTSFLHFFCFLIRFFCFLIRFFCFFLHFLSSTTTFDKNSHTRVFSECWSLPGTLRQKTLHYSWKKVTNLTTYARINLSKFIQVRNNVGGGSMRDREEHGRE